MPRQSHLAPPNSARKSAHRPQPRPHPPAATQRALEDFGFARTPEPQATPRKRRCSVVIPETPPRKRGRERVVQSSQWYEREEEEELERDGDGEGAGEGDASLIPAFVRPAGRRWRARRGEADAGGSREERAALRTSPSLPPPPASSPRGADTQRGSDAAGSRAQSAAPSSPPVETRLDAAARASSTQLPLPSSPSPSSPALHTPPPPPPPPHGADTQRGSDAAGSSRARSAELPLPSSPSPALHTPSPPPLPAETQYPDFPFAPVATQRLELAEDVLAAEPTESQLLPRELMESFPLPEGWGEGWEETQ